MGSTNLMFQGAQARETQRVRRAAEAAAKALTTAAEQARYQSSIMYALILEQQETNRLLRELLAGGLARVEPEAGEAR